MKAYSWRAHLLIGAISIAVFFLSNDPETQMVLYDATGLFAVAAILLGVRRNRPAHRLPWLFLAGGVLAFTLGDAIWNGYEMFLHRPAPWPSVADFVWLACPPLLALGLTGMLRKRGSGRDVEGGLDALIVATGAGALSWAFLMAPYASDASLGAFAKTVAIAYPLMDLLLVAVVVRLLIAPGRRPASHHLLAVAVTSTLVADIIYSILALNGAYYTGHMVDFAFLAFYWVIGAAALHPSMAHVSETEQRTRRPSRKRLVALAGAASLAPITLVIQAQRGAALDVPVLAGASIFMFTLVVLRMERLVREVDSKVQQLKVQGEMLRGSLDARETLESQLRYQALHDPLTDLANRTLFNDRVHHAINHVARGGHALGVLFIDLDDFKSINDTLGHEAGDVLLIDVSGRLRRLVRASDTAARLGGDEFAILLDGMAESVDAHVVADRILEAMRFPFLLNEREVHVNASIGIALSEDATVARQELLRRADVAMYAAKSEGKNGYVLFEPSLDNEVVGRTRLQSELQLAIGRGELRALYQPIVDLPAHDLIAAEALIRWAHPTKGLLSPAEFLPVAEESGLILDVDAWMLQEACSRAASWRRDIGAERPMYVSVNISGRTLQHADFVGAVASAIASTSVDPRDIVLEITESFLVRDIDKAIVRLEELKALGVRIAIDDFGTGYSSLVYLKRFPIDILKIDKAFVDRVAQGPEESGLARAIIMLAETRNLGTVAEGVEDEEQATCLAGLGTRAAQGYYFSRPVTADAISRFLAAPEASNWSVARRSTV